MKDQYEYLKKLQEIVFKDILVSKNILKNNQYVPSYRNILNDEQMVIDHRTIASNEIVFDFDFKSYNLTYKHAKMIISVLEERKIPYYIFNTGGKGLHIHIFFNKIEITSDEIKNWFEKALSYNFSWCHLRQFLFELICEEAGINKAYMGKYIDTKKINFNEMDDSSVLIRCCGGRNQKFEEITGITTTSYKTWIPNEDFKDKRLTIFNISNVKYPLEILPFSINQFELGQCLKDFATSSKELKKEVFEKISLPNGYLGLSSVQKILEGMPEGQRNEGAKILALALVLDKLGDKKCETIMEEYSKNCSQIGHQFSKSEAMSWLKWMKYQPKHFWNNEHVKKLGVWEKDTDEFYKFFKKDVIKILEKPGLLKLVDNYLKKEIIGEKDNRILIFLLLLSSKFKVDKEWNIPGDPKPHSIILSSLSASGKSYITKSILKLFGEEGKDYYTFSRMTGAVLNYFTNIDMNGKVLFVEELQGLDKDSNQLRLWVSEGKLKLATVEKIEVGEEVKNQLVIKESVGQPVFITGTAEDEIDEQMNNRSWLVSLDISEEQNKAILNFESKSASSSMLLNNDELRILQDAIKELNSYHFIIPFFDYELLNIPTNDVRIRRDYKKFRDLICCSALLHQKQRIIIKDNNEREFLIASLNDYEIAAKYSEKVLAATFSGLTSQQIWVLEQIKQEPWKDEFESAEIQRMTSWSQSKCWNVLKQLEEVGVITSNSRKMGASVVYALNHKKKLVNLRLPLRGELLEKIHAKNVTYFEFLEKYDFYHSEIIKNRKNQKDEIGEIQTPIFITEFLKKSPFFSQNDIDNIYKYGSNSPELELKINSEPLKLGEQNSFSQGVQPLKDENLTDIAVEKSSKIGEIGDNMRDKILEYFSNSSEHIISEAELEKLYGIKVYEVIDEMCKEGIFFHPKPNKLMKL